MKHFRLLDRRGGGHSNKLSNTQTAVWLFRGSEKEGYTLQAIGYKQKQRRKNAIGSGYMQTKSKSKKQTASVKQEQQTKETQTVIKAASKTKLHEAVRNKTQKLKTTPAENTPNGCVTIH